MEEDIKILKEFVKLYKEAAEEDEIERSCYFEEVPAQAIENILNRLEQDERVIKDATNYLEYYLLGRLDLEDSQEEFGKLLKILKGEK